jgi:diacylglycerol kinase family enzyme
LSSQFVFVVNAAAGKGLAPHKLRGLLSRFPEVAARARILTTHTPAELSTALALSDDDIPVAVGGDGSFNALLTALDQRGEITRPVGLIPFGTGNATAFTLGLSSAHRALAALERGQTTQLDVMRTSLPQTPLALVSCSTGFESGFLQRYGAVRYRSKQWAGWSALAFNFRLRVTGVSLILDNTPWVSPQDVVHNVGVYNIPHYAFGRVMWRGMRADDGLGIAALATSPLWYWNLMARGVPAPTAASESSDALRGVRTMRWSTAELHSPLPLQIDGEFVEARSALLHVVPRAITAFHAHTDAELSAENQR